MDRRLSFLIIYTVFFTSCMVGPNYHRPAVEIPVEWLTPLEGNAAWVNLPWWQEFGDPVLVELIAIAAKENKDLLIACGRVQEFAGLYRATYGDLFPLIRADATAGRQLDSKEVIGDQPFIPNPYNFYHLLLSGSWELDIWGKLRRATEAAKADLLAEEAVRKSVLQTVTTAVAASYVNLLKLDLQLQISINTAGTREKTLALFQKRYEAGVISKVDLSQIESEYQDALARIPEFRRQVAEQEHGIARLLGQNPFPIPRGKELMTLQFPPIPSSLPSNVLLQRPDIAAAEEMLIAANARIGVARAAYFPSISLTGEYGVASLDYKRLFTAGARTWNYFVPATMPIFTAGRISGTVQAAEAVKCQALAAYQKAIIEAFSEVENALVDIAQTKEQLLAEQQQVEALQEYARLANLRYNEGYTSYLEVLDAERSLFAAQLAFASTYGRLYFAIISLYKGLGGGWILEAERTCYSPHSNSSSDSGSNSSKVFALFPHTMRIKDNVSAART